MLCTSVTKTSNATTALTAARQPELAGLLDGVDHIAAAIGERHDFRA
jgi:hypothetical protein